MKLISAPQRQLQASGGCQSPDAFNSTVKIQGTHVPRSPIRFLKYVALILCIIAPAHSAALAQETQDLFSTSLDTLKTQVQAAEQRVSQAAAAVRQAKLAEMPDQKQLNILNAQLKIEVRNAFELTQQLQNAQLDDAEAHIAASRKRLETRQRLADRVVAKRIEELLTNQIALQGPLLAGDSATPRQTQVGPIETDPAEPLYQSVTRSEWQSRFANETEPATRIEAAQALVALAARDNAEERFERCVTFGAELMESGFGDNATRFVFSQTVPTYGRSGAGQEYCLWVYQPLNELFTKLYALLNQTDATLATIPPRQLADMLIRETNHDSIPRAAFATLLVAQNRILHVLKQDEDVRKSIVSQLKRSDDRPLQCALLRTQARFYDLTKDGGTAVGESFLNGFRKAGEELAAKPVTDNDTFALAGSWFDLQKQHAFSTQDVAARVVLRMLVFDETSTRRAVVLHESDRNNHSRPPGFFTVGESIRSEWIAAVNEYLKTQIEADPSIVSPAVIATINEFIRTQTPDEKWDTEETARLLTPLLENCFVAAEENDAESQSATAGQVSPHSLLSTILHCGSEIPRSVIESDSAYSPFPLLKSAIESANLQGEFTQFALPGELDILTFLAIADQLTGVSAEQDRKIAVFFLTSNTAVGRDDLLRTGSLLQRLQKEIVTAPSQKFLKRIEQKTKTDELRDAVRKLLPQAETASPAEN